MRAIMSTQLSEAIVVAAQGVHTKVWHKHWKEGDRVLRAGQVTDYIRDVRTNAGCTEQQLPPALLDLLNEARADRKQTFELGKLLVPLKDIVFAAA